MKNNLSVSTITNSRTHHKGFQKIILISFLLFIVNLSVLKAQNPPMFTLTTVSNYPSNCAFTGGGSYPADYSVSVTCYIATGYRLVSWSITATGTTTPILSSGTTLPINIKMNQNLTLTGTFAVIPSYTLTTTTTGSGTVSGGGTYYQGQVATLTALPASGYSFTGWGGAASGTANPITVTMDANKTVSATFSVSTPMWQGNGTKIFYNADNVGIGIMNPMVPLEVNGTVKATTLTTTGAVTAGSLNTGTVTSGNLTSSGTITAGYFSGDGTNITGLWTKNGSNLIYNVASGNVLIGQTTQKNSLYRLDVKGKVRFDDVQVNTDGADFVFEEGYKLRSLTELETYIKTNKHLPEIAPASDMQSNGMTLGEVQTRLLQKIEELTLYLIEKDKQLDAQQKKTEELQATVFELKATLDGFKKEFLSKPEFKNSNLNN